MNLLHWLDKLSKKLNQLECKHEWSPITINITCPDNRAGNLITAYAHCYKCGIGRTREHFVSRLSLYKQHNSTRSVDRFSWAIAGALAREIHGKKLTNYQLGWID